MDEIYYKTTSIAKFFTKNSNVDFFCIKKYLNEVIVLTWKKNNCIPDLSICVTFIEKNSALKQSIIYITVNPEYSLTTIPTFTNLIQSITNWNRLS